MMTVALSPSPALVEPTPSRGLGGLLALAGRVETPLPLAEVRVRASISGSVCLTTIEQRFTNHLTEPMEAVHLFPVPEAGAIAEVTLRCGDLVVQAECRERSSAEAVFAEARTAGHRAALVTRERDDIHTLRVTNLPPGESVSVTILLVEHLDPEDGSLRWRFPTTIAPRFLPGNPTGHSGPGILPDTDAAPDASRLQPPLRLSGGTKLDLEVLVRGAPTRITSSQHAVSVEMGDGVRIAPSASATLDRDFVLAVSYARSGVPALQAWTSGAFTLVTLDGAEQAAPEALPRDAVFVVDISGSMEGTKLQAAKRALTTALHGLVDRDRFTLIAFDDQLEMFAQEPTPYDERSLARADRWIASLAARGGTEMLPAIQAALAGTTPEGRLRTVLFITDGQAHNEAELAAAVANRRKAARFHTLGIDTAVNGALLTRLARMGGGTCTLCTPSDNIEAVVARLEARFGSPLATDVQFEGGEAAAAGPHTWFAGRSLSLLLRGPPGTVRATGRTSQGPFQLEVTPGSTEARLATLWARARVAELEDRLVVRPFEEEAILPEITRIALEGGIASRGTAFVAVERSRATSGAPRVVIQPHEAPADWATLGDAGAGSLGGAPGGPPSASRPAPKAASPVIARMRGSGAPAAPPPAPAPAYAPPPPQAVPAVFAADLPAEEAERLEAYDDAAPEAFASMRATEAPGPLRRLASYAAGVLRPGRPASADQARSPAPGESKKKEAEPLLVREPDAPVYQSLSRSELEATLAASQSADGSYGGSTGRTAAALAAFVLLGHTTRSGLRQRGVKKAAAWLRKHADDALAELALLALAQAEAGGPVVVDLSPLRGEGIEGSWVSTLLAHP